MSYRHRGQKEDPITVLNNLHTKVYKKPPVYKEEIQRKQFRFELVVDWGIFQNVGWFPSRRDAKANVATSALGAKPVHIH